MSIEYPKVAITTPREGGDSENFLAAIYARTSSNSQRFGYSIDEQVRRSWDYCTEAGWTVKFVFTDEAKSGRDTERPKFQSMLEQARYGSFDVVVFWKLDRFCRSLVDLVKIEEELNTLNVALHSVTEVLDTTNPVGRFNFRNLASAAELESDLISQRVKMGMYGLARDHKWPNERPPLGYEKHVDGTLMVDHEESTIVVQIFETYIEVRSMPEVAFILNKNNICTKNGNRWCRQSVAKVLKNELYIGNYRIADYQEYVDEYRILPDELFEQVAKIRYRFKRTKSSMNPSRKYKKAERILSSYRTYYGDHA